MAQKNELKDLVEVYMAINITKRNGDIVDFDK